MENFVGLHCLTYVFCLDLHPQLPTWLGPFALILVTALPSCYWEVLVPSMSVIPSLSGSLVCLVLNIFLVSSDLTLPLLVIDIVTPTLSSDRLRISLYVGGAWGAVWIWGKAACLEELQSLCFYLNCMFIWDGLRVAVEILFFFFF